MLNRRIRRDRRHGRLVFAARAGNRRAFRILYRELFPPVTRYLHSRLGDSDEVEDLVSKVFHRFLERLESFHPGRGSVLAWLLGIAHNALIDLYRERKKTVPVDGLEESLVGRAGDPLQTLLREERARRVHRLLQGLPPEVRRMFSLRFEQDLRYREIAVCMGLSEAAVKQRFSRAMRDLKARWKAATADRGEVDYAI